jgi:signal transduction histidine kinase
MFKKLRNGILALNMVITSIVMILAFMVVFLITAANIQADNEHKALNNPSFAVTVDENGVVQQTLSAVDLAESEYRDAVVSAWEHRGDSTYERVEFAGRTWIYLVSYAESLVIDMSDAIAGENGATGAIVEALEGDSGTLDTPGILEKSWRINFLDITDSQKTLQDLLLTFLAVGVVMLGVIFFISLFFANRAMRPVVEAWDRQRRFVADASHELRTPLAIMSANYDALLMNKKETIESQMEWLEYMHFGMERMTKLTNDLLTLNSVENSALDPQFAEVDMSAVVGDVVASMDSLAAEKHLELRPSIASGVVVLSDRSRVEQVITALYENAVKYTPEGGAIEVSLAMSGGRVICSVRNTGEGIDPEALAHIFDRFYRADASRTSETAGYGLGLSIAKTIAEKLGGDLTAESIPDEWTTFTLTL